MYSRTWDSHRLVRACCRGRGSTGMVRRVCGLERWGAYCRVVFWECDLGWRFLLTSAVLLERFCPDDWRYYCHGLFVRWGETRSQLPRNGLYLRCEMSSRIFSGILAEEIQGIRWRKSIEQVDRQLHW
jgi:hypothetical protein